MPGIRFIFFGVAGFLPLVVDFVFLQVSLEDIFGGHTKALGDGDEEMEQVDDFHLGVLFIEFLIFRPPFPGNTVDQFSHFLAHGARIVEDPFGFFFLGQVVQIDSDPFVQYCLEAENFFQFIGCAHSLVVKEGGG